MSEFMQQKSESSELGAAQAAKAPTMIPASLCFMVIVTIWEV
jgi:hypothetical protein